MIKNNKKDIRNKILYASLELFSEKGYASTSVDDIAKKTKLTKGAIYWHFKDKLDLYTAVHDFVFDEYKKRFPKPLTEIKDPLEKLEYTITMTLQFYKDNPIIVSFYSTSFHESHFDLSPRILNRIKETYKEDRDLISQIIADGIQYGQFIEVDPEITASILVALLDGILTQWMFEKEIDLDLAARSISLIFYKGIEKKKVE